MNLRDATRILTRHANNPLLQVKDYPGVAQLYNPAPARIGDETIILVSVVEHAAKMGYGRDVGQTRIARSTDGVNFTLGTENFISTQAEGEPWSLYHHFIDNRVTKIEDWYYIVTPVMVRGYLSPVGMLGRTRDFKTYERLDIITQPSNRGASLFPEKINGLYYKLDRPASGSLGDIWCSSSPDLLHWGAFKPVLAANYRFWNNQKVGPTPPIKTDKGWLVIMHGVYNAQGFIYYLGAILLDLEEPWKVIGRTMSPILAPEMPYELQGNVPGVVFACGALADAEKDEIRLYYGAADSSICLATGRLSELTQACLDQI